MSDKIMEAGFDHPCKQTCSGWEQGRLRGRAEVQGLVWAAHTLRNEVKGTLYAHRIAIGYDHGNSNWACLEMALAQVDAALKEFKDKT